MSLFETSRLSFQKAELADAPFFLELMNSPKWIKHIGDRGIKNITDAEKYIEESLTAHYSNNGFSLFKVILKTENKAIGICGLLKRSYLDHPDLGFATLPQYEGYGYTFEAAKATLEYSTSTLGIQKVLAITTEENHASQKLLEKVGMKFVQKIKDEQQTELFLYST